MDLTTAQNIFAVRLYEWSQREFLRELEEGCPLLSSIGLNDRYLAAFVAWNETLLPDERKSLVIALTRRCHENARRLRGEVLTEVQEEWHKTCVLQMKIRVESDIPPLVTADTNRPGFRPVDPDECLNYLVNQLSPEMGSISRRASKVICTRKIGEWRIITEFTFLRKDRFLQFEYQFIRKDGVSIKSGHPAQGPFPRTLFFFFGLSYTMVMVPSTDDSEPMAKVMANLAEYFVIRAAPLFEGLGVSD